MKKPTLLVIISICILITVNLFWFTISIASISIDSEISYQFSKITRFLELIAYVGLLPFFVTLYKKQ
jgi:hypothetical protein